MSDPKHPRRGELRYGRTLRNDRPDRLPALRDPVWEIQPGETQRAYDRFRVYRDLGSSRTQTRAAEILGLTINAKHPTSAPNNGLGDLSSKYRWVERVRAYDAWLDTVHLASVEQAAREASRSWIARGDAIRQMEYDLAIGLGKKVADMLEYPIKEVTRTHTVVVKGGKTIINYYTTWMPARWDWKGAADMLGKLGYQARLAADMVTDGARAPSPDLTDRGVADIDAWLADLGVKAEARDRGEE